MCYFSSGSSSTAAAAAVASRRAHTSISAAPEWPETKKAGILLLIARSSARSQNAHAQDGQEQDPHGGPRRQLIAAGGAAGRLPRRARLRLPPIRRRVGVRTAIGDCRITRHSPDSDSEWEEQKKKNGFWGYFSLPSQFRVFFFPVVSKGAFVVSFVI